jgi:hypothetical protein
MRLLAATVIVFALWTPMWAKAHYQPGQHNVRHAINLAPEDA